MALTAGFVSSKGANFKSEMLEQRKETDSVLNTYLQSLKEKAQSIQKQILPCITICKQYLRS